jgi:tripartite-type tricarboxylate transporter receptor subunit TctC
MTAWLGVLVAGYGADPTPTISTAEYFRGKTVTIVYGQTGNFQVNALATAASLSKYIPGNPQVKVRLLEGQSGLRAAVSVLQSKPNGFTIGMFGTGLVSDQLAGGPPGPVDITKIRNLGSTSYNVQAYPIYVRSELATSWKEVMKKKDKVKIGGSTPGATTWGGILLDELDLAPIQMLYGYKGTNEYLAATDRKETDGFIRGGWTRIRDNFPNWYKNVAQPFVVPVVYWGPNKVRIDQEWIDLLRVEHPPYLFDVVKVPIEVQQMAESVAFLSPYSRQFFVPERTPDNAYKALRDAMEAVTRDSRFIAAHEAASLEHKYGSPEQFKERVIHAAMGAPAEHKALFKKMIGAD